MRPTKTAILAAALALLATCTSTPPAAVCNGADLKKNDANCGACGSACPTGEACANSACFPKDCTGRPCEPDQVCASGSCVDKDCVGVLCPAGMACAKGTCVCESTRTDCSGSCADLTRDDRNCGACGRACSAGQHCARGECFAASCADEACDPLSVCYQGACIERACVGVLCPGAEECAGGICGCQGSVCGGACANTRLDERHCGTCGADCDGGTSCAAGTCLPNDCPSADCDPLSVCYQGSCVEAECVGVLCPTGKLCSTGRCLCPTGKLDCDGACADVTQSAQHCGSCGAACDAGESCSARTCAPSACPPGRQRCAGNCVDVTTDPTHCGQCGDACGAGRNCVAGRCTCPQGLALCGASCVNFATDPQHCGSCGRSCNGGTCQTDGGCSCSPGLTACAGQCRDLSNDPQFCGSCTRVCPVGETCGSGTCQCQPGFTRCNGTCLDTRSDPTRCGTCNRVCNSGEVCAASACVAPLTMQANFNPAVVAFCPAFPLTAGSCDNWSPLPQQRFMGTLTTPMTATHALTPPLATEQRIDFQHSATAPATSFIRIHLRTAAGAFLTTDSAVLNVGVMPTWAHTWYWNPGACGRVVDVHVVAASATVSYDVTATPYTQPGFSHGGDSPDAAVPIATPDAGPACELLCGRVSPCSTADTGQWFTLVVPPQKAVALYMRGRTGTEFSSGNLFVTVYDDQGRYYGYAFVMAVLGPSADATARLVNNQLVPQRLYLRIFNDDPDDIRYSLAIAQEP